MACSIACLDDSTLQPLVNLLDAIPCCRLFICGNKVLMAKISRSLTRFKLELHPKQRPVFPPIISHFSALTDVDIGYADRKRRACIGFIDYNLLPPTLTSLKLSFADALFTIINLPALSDPHCKHRPRLTFPLIQKFSNLQQLELSNRFAFDVQNWDFSDVLDGLFAPGSLLTFLSAIHFKYDWSCSELSRLPANVRSLWIPWGNKFQQSLASFKVPPHITDLFFPTEIEPVVICLLPGTLTSVTVRVRDSDAVEFQHFRSLLQLETFMLYTDKFNDNVAENLPIALKFVFVDCKTLQYASLAKLTCQCLEGLLIRWDDIVLEKSVYSRLDYQSRVPLLATSEEHALIEHVTSFLPRTLRLMSAFLFECVAPRFWKLLPPRIISLHETREQQTNFGADAVSFISSLPKWLKRSEIAPLTPMDVVQLPTHRCMSKLQLSTVKAEYLSVMNGFPNLRDLILFVDETFEIGWMSPMKVRLQRLELRPTNEWKRASDSLPNSVSAGSRYAWDSSSHEMEILEVPWWAQRLRDLEIDETITPLLPTSVLHRITTLPTLKILDCMRRAACDSKKGIPARLVPRLVFANLSHELTNLSLKLLGFNHEALELLPRTLEALILRAPECEWYPEHLDRLSRLNTLEMPLPTFCDNLDNWKGKLGAWCWAHPSLLSATIVGFKTLSGFGPNSLTSPSYQDALSIRRAQNPGHIADDDDPYDA